MVLTYLSARGDIYFKCSSCQEMKFIPVELKTSPFWEHYSGVIILTMIQHYLDAHTQKPRSQSTDIMRHGWPAANDWSGLIS
jgi:hypothetical protein